MAVARIDFGSTEALQPYSEMWWLKQLEDALVDRMPMIDKCEQYYAGQHNLAFATPKFKEAFGRLFSEFSDNWCELVTDSSVERLTVQGFRYDKEDASGDTDAWEMWQANGLDSESVIAHTTSCKTGWSYAMVGPGSDYPEITIEHPCEVIVATAPGGRRTRQAALKRWDDELGYRNWYVYMPDVVHKYQSRGPVRKYGTPTPEWFESVTNPLGVVPIIPIANDPDGRGFGTSDIVQVIPTQDAVNKLIADMMVSAEFNAFPQRTMTGVEVTEGDESTTKMVNDLMSGASRLWSSTSPDTKFGAFPESTLSGFVSGIELLIQHIAARTRTPPHYLLGQALALDTIVPTPKGLTTMGDLEVGDEVYDECGRAQVVEQAFAVLHDEPCFRLTFNDGSEVVADADHKWVTSHYTKTRAGRDVPRETSVVTTAQIAETLRVRGGQGWSSHHFIPTSRALEAPSADLPIDPYVLGVWLGDGDNRGGQITQHIGDSAELVRHLMDCGERVELLAEHGKETVHKLAVRSPRAGRCLRGHERDRGAKNCIRCERDRRSGQLGPIVNATLTRRLKAVGMLHNKHIPETYFAASPEQRLSLLQGLMDADGHAGTNGQVEFTQSDERLSRDVFRLAASLGHKPRIASRVTTHRRQWRVTWSAPVHVFRLARKVAAQTIAKDDGHGLSAGPFRRYIVACEPVESVPVRCISVSGDSHQFLITEACIATHNSGNFPSGDSLKATETGLVAKVRKKQLFFGESWEEIMRLAFLLKGDTKRGNEVGAETLWRDPESRSQGELVDSLVKMATIGVPQEALWQRYGASPQEIARWQEMQAAQAARVAATTPPPANGSTEKTGLSGDPTAPAAQVASA